MLHGMMYFKFSVIHTHTQMLSSSAYSHPNPLQKKEKKKSPIVRTYLINVTLSKYLLVEFLAALLCK